MLFYSFIYSIQIHTAKKDKKNEKERRKKKKVIKKHLCKFNGQS